MVGLLALVDLCDSSRGAWVEIISPVPTLVVALMTFNSFGYALVLITFGDLLALEKLDTIYCFYLEIPTDTFIFILHNMMI